MVSKKVLHQTSAALPALLNYITEGIGYGWVASSLLKLQTNQEFSLTINELSWLGSAHELGKIIGPLIAVLLIDRIGRKIMLVMSAIISFLTWFSISVCTSVMTICVARVVFGIGIGINNVAGSIYMGENFSPNLRAVFCSTTTIAYYTAEMCEFAIASMYSFRVVAAINGVIAFVGLLCMYLTRETPQYLLMRRNSMEAEKNYTWLRGIASADNEFSKIKENVRQERRKKSFWQLVSTKANYRSVTIVSLLISLRTATGGDAALAYVAMLFSSNELLTQYQFAVLFAFVRVIVSSLTPFYIERLRRRTIIVSSFIIMALLHLSTAILCCVHTRLYPIKYFSWIIFGAVTVCASVYTVLAPLTSAVRGELFPQSVKALANLVVLSLHSVVAFVVMKTFLNIKETYGPEMNFLFFAMMSFAGFLYTFLKLPETRGKTLVDIQSLLEN